MELDDFKSTWDKMSNQDKENLNTKIADTVNSKKVQSGLKKIILPELLGSIICIGSAVFIAFNFYKLDTVSFKIAGITAILLFIILPAISLFSIQQLHQSTDITKSYADTLKDFALQKIKFCKRQKLNLTLSYILFVAVILISTRLFGRNKITDDPYFFIISFSLGYIALFFFSKWVFKKYNLIIWKTEELLIELQSWQN